MKNKLLILLLVLTVIPASFSANAETTKTNIPLSEYSEGYVSSQDIDVYLNGTKIQFPDTQPVIVNGRTMVPMRSIFEAFGVDVEWIPEQKKVYSNSSIAEIALFIGYTSMYIDGREVEIDVAPFIENGRTMVPLRAISEAFRASVYWDSEAYVVDICTDGYTPQPHEPKVQKDVFNGVSPTANESDSIPDETVQYPEVEVLNAVNDIRAKNGLEPLKWSNSLAAVARAHSDNMAKNKFFSHTDPSGQTASDRIKNAGISYRVMAENIAAGQTTANDVVNSWMQSDGHRNNILNPNLTHLGVGLAADNTSEYKFYWTQCFIGSASSNAKANTGTFEYEVFNLVNQERAKYGLPPVSWNEDLAVVAREHSKDMCDRGFFSHTNPSGKSPFDRIKRHGITYRIAAENIACGQDSPVSVMEAWMNSEGHRANILNGSLTELGVGVYINDSGYGYYWTQNFRTPIQ